MKSIIVSGGAGFIGSHMCDRILQRNDVEKLVVVDNLWTGRLENLSHIQDPRFHFEQSDVENVRTSQEFDEVYHFASPASPPWYMKEPRRTISANLLGAMRLLDILKDGGRFCFTSSSEVYGDPLVSPQPETYKGQVDCTGPRSSYDESKRCTESLLFEMQRTQGLNLKVVRPFNVYGPRTRPDDGRAVSNFIAQALTGQPITVYGDGSQSRSWGYIDDIVDGFSRYFWLNETAYKGPLNVGNDREISVLEVAKYVSNLVGGVPIVFKPSPPDDPTNRRPDLTIANRVMAEWSCKFSYEQGVAKTLDWFKEKLKVQPRSRRKPRVKPLHDLNVHDFP